jgi:hypothetical protein
MSKAIEDIRWVASEVNDLAILLRVHGFGTLAGKLDAVRKALRSELTAIAPALVIVRFRP